MRILQKNVRRVNRGKKSEGKALVLLLHSAAQLAELRTCRSKKNVTSPISKRQALAVLENPSLVPGHLYPGVSINSYSASVVDVARESLSRKCRELVVNVWKKTTLPLVSSGINNKERAISRVSIIVSTTCLSNWKINGIAILLSIYGFHHEASRLWMSLFRRKIYLQAVIITANTRIRVRAISLVSIANKRS